MTKRITRSQWEAKERHGYTLTNSRGDWILQGGPRGTELVQVIVGLEQGDRVKITSRGPLGLVAHLDAAKFVDEVAQPGEEGEYLGPHPNPNLEHWHVIRFEKGDRELFCPVAEGMFEPVEPPLSEEEYRELVEGGTDDIRNLRP